MEVVGEKDLLAELRKNLNSKVMAEFPHILVINLSNREDRWKEIQESFQSWPRLERVDAIQESPGWKGCIKSHKKSVEFAKERGYPWVLVLEDDCVCNSDSFKRFEALLPTLWEKREEWDIFLGGTTFIKKVAKKTDDPLFEVGAYTTHFVLIHSESYNKILLMPENNPIDIYFKDKLRCWCTSPHIATQKDGMSDIMEQTVNYSQYFNNSSRVLERAIGAKEGKCTGHGNYLFTELDGSYIPFIPST